MPKRTSSLEELIELLRNSGHNLRCEEIRQHLERFGFQVKSGKKAGHKVVDHETCQISFNYDCGHGRNPTPKRPYLKKIARELEIHREEIEGTMEASK